MKMQKIVSWFCLLLCIAIVSGCAHPVVQSTATISPFTPTIQVTMTIAVKTATPALGSSATVTITSLPTLTDIPTLPAEDARQRLLVLLANNNDCQLPCLWGITPGKRNYLEARHILMPLIGVADFAYFYPGIPADSISPLYVEGSQRLYTQVTYSYNSDGVIESIYFRALEEQLGQDEYGNLTKTPIFDSQTFLKRAEYYLLSHVLSEQGKPEAVLVQASGLLIGGVMDIVLIYPSQGIWVDYTMKIIRTNSISKLACPTNAYINMMLFPPGDPESFFSLLERTDWTITKSGYIPLAEATSMTVEEFYKTFRNPTDKCIETPTNLWPTPESGGG